MQTVNQNTSYTWLSVRQTTKQIIVKQPDDLINWTDVSFLYCVKSSLFQSFIKYSIQLIILIIAVAVWEEGIGTECIYQFVR